MSSLWPLELLAQDGITVAQQHSVLDLVRGSGLVVQAILYLLVLFSVVSWGIIAQKYRQIRRAKRESEKFIEIFWERRNLSSIHDASRELSASPVGQVFRSGYEELVRVSRAKKESSTGDNLTTDLTGVDNVSRAMKRATRKASDAPIVAPAETARKPFHNPKANPAPIVRIDPGAIKTVATAYTRMKTKTPAAPMWPTQSLKLPSHCWTGRNLITRKSAMISVSKAITRPSELLDCLTLLIYGRAHKAR